MEEYSTEEQQVEAIKKFWKENGTSIILGAVIGLGGLWGWRYYNEERIAAQEQASEQYEQAVIQLVEGEQGYQTAKQFVSENPDNHYAALAALQLAQQAVDAGNLDDAATQLQLAAEKAGVDALAGVARIRLARVQLQQQAYDDAMATLDKVTNESYRSLVLELKGDVYVAQEKPEQARSAYSEALQLNAGNNLLKLKLDNLQVLASL
ncbi:tetratricopeptide repeat protein [Lacimicrobium sp. SS2-24]|uniref:YfgM family protein n=1 Tax=Lacimicrobium sp. SS2-24 TaxID=2005569 RepID=UPI000B4B59CA|nr:tetratricopeptide repeat protein [Lacimicrobium sp. SS2-24]